MSISFDPALVEQVAHTLNLREPNQQALYALAEALDTAPAGVELVADLATGVGKTYIAGGLLDYLCESGVRNVVVITPGKTIQRKTVANLTPGSAKYLRGLQCNPEVITLDDLERGTVAQALDDPDRFKVFVLTVQSLLRPDTKEARRAHRAHETLGQALYEYLQSAPDLVVIADEHHIYFSGSARRFEAAVQDLRPAALIGLTATPHESTDPTKIVYRYPLAEAIADGWVKIPVLVARPDGAKDVRTQMADGVALLDAKAAAMTAYCRQTRQQPVAPILFVVAQTIEEATEYRDLLSGPDFLGSAEKVLLVTSKEPDAALAQLDALEDPTSPVRAVVSVSMLKEGWDVKNIYVIASVRAMESQLLTEQILGRGLRLPFGARTGVPMLDTVEVLSHHAFRDLLRDAKTLLEQTLGDRARDAQIIANPMPGVRGSLLPISAGGEPATAAAGEDLTEVVVVLTGAGAPAPDGTVQPSLWDDQPSDDPAATHTGPGISLIGARLHEAAATTRTLTTTHRPRPPAGVAIPLFLPRVTVRSVRDPFSLASVDLLSVEALGRRFAKDDAPTLNRKMLDAERDADGAATVTITDATDQVAASQIAMPFDRIEDDLVTRLLASNTVETNLTEANASERIAQAFLTGAQVTEATPWRKEHAQLATHRLVNWIGELRMASRPQEVREVALVRWPEPAERMETRPPADRHLITTSTQFTKGYPYSGWHRSIYDVNTFDAYSTEFRLASLFETATGVKAWARIDHTVPLRITYQSGPVQRMYEPDFIVVAEDGVHWLTEGKADGEMANSIVLAKRDAAKAWVAAVNADPAVQDRWAYLLASETTIRNSTTWTALLAGAQTYR